MDAARILILPLRLPGWIARVWRAVRARFVDLRRILHGLATRDQPRTQYLFLGATRGRTLRMLLSQPGHIEDELAHKGFWEPHVAAALTFFARPGGVFVDVGANIGYHALYVASSCPDVKVVCFEPNPFVRAELERNAALNPELAVEVRAAALGDHDGSVEFHAQSGRAYNRGASSILRNYNVGSRYEKVTVDLRTLDGELGDARVDLIKIDTEGFEGAVLAGAQALIARCRPVVVFEFDSRFLDDPPAELAKIRALLPGYDLHTLGPNRPELGPFADRSVRSKLFGADLIALPGSQA
jgi:FkbM family methyltransferase